MAYETGTALDGNDLLDKLRIFALAQGWTVNSWAVRSDGGTGYCLNLTKGDIVGALYSGPSLGSVNDPGHFIGGYLYPAYSGGNPNMTQANASGYISTNGLGSSQFVAYHFFAGPKSLHVVVEVTTGTFKHFGIGQLEKFGAVTNGAYIFQSNWNYTSTYKNNPDLSYHAIPFDGLEYNPYSRSLVIRADADAESPKYWYPNTYSPTAGNRLVGGWRDNNSSQGASQLYQAMKDCSASSITGRAPLWPLWVAVHRGSYLFSPIGYPENMRAIRLDNLTPDDVLTIGSDEWKVFPVIRKNGTASDVNSGNYGFAYKK